MPRFVSSTWFQEGQPESVGRAAFYLLDVLKWADVQITSETDDIELYLHDAHEVGDGYASAHAKVLDPLGSTGKPGEFFDRELDASFIALSWLYIKEPFNCTLSTQGRVLGRLRIRRMADVILTKRTSADS